MSSPAAIEVSNLGKVYDTVDAVKNLSLSVQIMERSFGLLGPNGAGKSTTPQNPDYHA